MPQTCHSPDPNLLWRLLGKLLGKLGVLEGVPGELLRRLPLLCSSGQEQSPQQFPRHSPQHSEFPQQFTQQSPQQVWGIRAAPLRRKLAWTLELVVFAVFVKTAPFGRGQEHGLPKTRFVPPRYIQKNPRIRKMFCPQFWGRKWVRQFYGRPILNAFFLQENLCP